MKIDNKKTIYNKIIIMIAVVVIIISAGNISSASLVGSELTIAAGWYGDIYYSYNGEETKAMRRSCNNEPVYVMKKNNTNTRFTTTDIELYENEAIKNIIKNGYGGKTAEEMGYSDIVEPFLATQEAIYITLEGRNIDDYELVTDSGKRVLDMTKQILEDATNEKEETITIVEETAEWSDYEIDNNYKYKKYIIQSDNTINGKIEIKQAEDIKILDITTNEGKQEFIGGDSFYLVVPKYKDQEIKINFSYETEEIILYTTKYEDKLEETYILFENGTKQVETTLDITIDKISRVEIINQDNETKEPIVGNVFNILTEDNVVVKENLTTNEEGKITTELAKGIYYLQQTSAVEDYGLNKGLIEIDVENKADVSIKIDSSKVTTEEITTFNKEINVTEENKNVIENNITDVSNIKTTNVNKEVINQKNETYLSNVNNFVNTTNKTDTKNLEKENTYQNYIAEQTVGYYTLEGDNVTMNMTREDYINYIDMIMLNASKVPVLPVAAK